MIINANPSPSWRRQRSIKECCKASKSKLVLSASECWSFLFLCFQIIMIMILSPCCRPSIPGPSVIVSDLMMQHLTTNPCYTTATATMLPPKTSFTDHCTRRQHPTLFLHSPFPSFPFSKSNKRSLTCHSTSVCICVLLVTVASHCTGHF